MHTKGTNPSYILLRVNTIALAIKSRELVQLGTAATTACWAEREVTIRKVVHDQGFSQNNGHKFKIHGISVVLRKGYTFCFLRQPSITSVFHPFRRYILARHWLRGSNLQTWVCRTKSHLILHSFYTQEPQLPSILHRISKAGRTEYSGRVLRADSGGGGRCGKEQTDYFFPLLANEERPPLPLLNNNPQVRMRSSVAGGYLRRGHRGCGSAPNSGHRDQQTSANPRSRPPTLGIMAAVAAASAELLIIGWYIFRVLLQVSICPGFGWERAPKARP